MFVYSMKGKSIKIFGAAFFACAAIAAALLILPEKDITGTAYVSCITNEKISFKGIKTEKDRLGFIESFGIKVAEVPVETYETKLPKEFDAVYNEYNSIQKAQGLDLSQYKGKKITRYTYEVLNYPGAEPTEENPSGVYLNLVMYKEKVIAGDIASSSMGGFVRTFCDFSDV